MNQTSWHKIEELFNAAWELPAEKRNEFLAISCAGDEELKKEVLSLLENMRVGESLFEKPVFSLRVTLFRRE